MLTRFVQVFMGDHPPRKDALWLRPCEDGFSADLLCFLHGQWLVVSERRIVHDAGNVRTAAYDPATSTLRFFGAGRHHLFNVPLSNVADLTSRMDTLETSVTTNASDIDALETRMDTAEADVDSLESRMDTAEADIDNLESRTTAVETSVSSLETSLSTAEADIDTAEADIDTLEESVNTIQSTLSWEEID